MGPNPFARVRVCRAAEPTSGYAAWPAPRDNPGVRCRWGAGGSTGERTGDVGAQHPRVLGGAPPAGRWLLSTVAVQTLGRGLTLPFTVIYLHEVRGISLDLAGLLMAFIAVVALAVTGPAGALTDRLGARTMLLWGTSAQLVGLRHPGLRDHSRSRSRAAFLFLGFNFGVSWPAFNALVAAVVTGQARQQYFGINFALVNLGIGLGGVVGGLYADVDNPTSFTVIFLADAASMLVPIGLLLGPLRHVHGRAEKPDDAVAARAPTSRSCASRRCVWLTLLTFLGVFVGYGQMEAGFPAFARQVSGVSTGRHRVRVRHQHRRHRRAAVLRAASGSAGRAAHPGAHRHGGAVVGRLGRARPHRAGQRHVWPRPRACCSSTRCSRSARRCSSRPSPRSPTTWRPTTCAAATTRSTPAPSRPGRSSARWSPGSCSTTGGRPRSWR